MQGDFQKKELEKDLIKKLNKLKDKAKSAHNSDAISTLYGYYDGASPSSTAIGGSVGANTNKLNIIKPIVETLCTMVLDYNVTTSVVPTVFSHSDFDQIDTIENIASVLNDVLKHVLTINNQDTLKNVIIRSACITGFASCEIYWDQTMANGLGDIRIDPILTNGILIDPSAKKIEDANYIFVEKVYSTFSLKKKYPDLADKIDEIAQKSASGGQKEQPKNRFTGFISTYSLNAQTGQVFSNGGNNPNAGVENVDKTITVSYCYLKDDSVFSPSNDEDKEIDEIASSQFKYPNGRVVVYAQDLILEDRPIDYPFGYPFTKMNWYPSQTSIWGSGIVSDLTEIQNNINLSSAKIKGLINMFISTIMVSKFHGVVAQNIMSNSPVTVIDDMGGMANFLPQVLTNNTLSQIEFLINYIDVLQKQAKQISRVNDMMLNGDRPKGVNSGEMVDSLIESPMASIREVQRALANFMIDLSNKIIKMIPIYYNVPRMIRMSGGKKFAQVMPKDQETQEDGYIRFFEFNEHKKQYEVIQEIMGDLSLGDYEVQVVAGLELPKNREALAKLTMNLMQSGVFGDPNSVSAKELLLNQLDYPNKDAIIARLKDEEQQSLSAPQAAMKVDKIAVAFKDLPIEAQVALIGELGLPAAESNITSALQGDLGEMAQ